MIRVSLDNLTQVDRVMKFEATLHLVFAYNTLILFGDNQYAVTSTDRVSGGVVIGTTMSTTGHRFYMLDPNYQSKLFSVYYTSWNEIIVSGQNDNKAGVILNLESSSNSFRSLNMFATGSNMRHIAV